jgi:hypothetical protein
VTLAAGLEVLLRPSPDWQAHPTNSIETARGAAASFLDRGADRIYLFNYMDSQTAMDDLHNYPALLREIGSLNTLAGKPRRHVLTFADTWAPGEPRAYPLPATIPAGGWHAFRIHIGPQPHGGEVRVCIGIAGEHDPRGLRVYVNGVLCDYAGPHADNFTSPRPDAPLHVFAVPLAALQHGYNVVDVQALEGAQVVWVELAIR